MGGGRGGGWKAGGGRYPQGVVAYESEGEGLA
jgi:hypothetical protein